MIVLDLKKLPPPFLKNVLKLLHKNSFPFYSVVFQYYIKCSKVLSGLICHEPKDNNKKSIDLTRMYYTILYTVKI